MSRDLGESRHSGRALFACTRCSLVRRPDKRSCRFALFSLVIRSRLGLGPRPSFPGGSCLHPRGQCPHPLGGWVSHPALAEGLRPRSRSGVLRGPVRPGGSCLHHPSGGRGFPRPDPGTRSPSAGQARAACTRFSREASRLSAPSPLGGWGGSPVGSVGNLGPGSPASGRLGKSRLDPFGGIAPASATPLTEIPAGHPNRELSPESRTPLWEGWEESLDRRLSAVVLSSRAATSDVL